MTFEEYWGEDPDPGKISARHAWNAAQAAERERIKQIVRDVTEGRSNCNLLLERIAANED